MKAKHAPRCMVCGPENPNGWGLEMVIADDRVRAKMTFDERHEGGPGVVHGGAVAAVLDDTMGSVLILLRRPAVTANLSVDYRQPVYMGRELTVEAWCDRTEGKKLFLAGHLLDGDTLIAEATGLFIEVGIERFHPEGAPDWFSSRP